MRECALQHHRDDVAAAAAPCGVRTARAYRVVVGGRMRRRSSAAVRGRRAGPPAPAPPRNPRCRRSRRRCRPHALGASAGVCGHGAAGRAGGTAPTARSQTPPFHIGMGEAAAATGNGGAPARDGGAGDASALRCGRRETGPAAQHTAARRRVRTGCTFAAASPLSASRADEEQLPASTEQVRERRAGVGWRGGGRRAGRWGRWGRWRCRRREEGWVAAEGDAVVGAHRSAAAAGVPAGERAAAVRDGATPRAARRVTSAPAPAPLPPPSPISRLHSIIGTIGLAGAQRSRVPKYYRLCIYLFGTRGSAAVPCACVCHCVVCVRVPCAAVADSSDN